MQGGIAEVAKRTDTTPETLSEILSSDAAPRLDTLAALLNALGCRLSIKPLEAENPSAKMGDMDAPVAPIEGAAPNMELATDNQ